MKYINKTYQFIQVRWPFCPIGCPMNSNKARDHSEENQHKLHDDYVFKSVNTATGETGLRFTFYSKTYSSMTFTGVNQILPISQSVRHTHWWYRFWNTKYHADLYGRYSTLTVIGKYPFALTLFSAFGVAGFRNPNIYIWPTVLDGIQTYVA